LDTNLTEKKRLNSSKLVNTTKNIKRKEVEIKTRRAKVEYKDWALFRSRIVTIRTAMKG